MKRRARMSCLLAVALTFSAACSVSTPLVNPDEYTSERWELSEFASFTQQSPDETHADGNGIVIGAVGEDDSSFAFVRFDAGTGFFAEEVREARLFLKLKDGDGPAGLRAVTLTGTWDGYFTVKGEAEMLIGHEFHSGAVRTEADGWFSFPVTEAVKIWLSGSLANNGAGLFADGDWRACSFEESDTDAPYILVTGMVGERSASYGKYAYLEMTNGPDGEITGNCLSYALLDTCAVEDIHLGSDPGEMASLYAAGGLDALDGYFARLLEEYVASNADGLAVSGFRRIDGFDSPVDPRNEYVIAMRLGVMADSDGVVDFTDPRAFDYHFWMRINDGRWAQKFPTETSQIVPCTGPGISPGAYPWHSSYYWTVKSKDFYTSGPVYFAVTKDSEGFTSHRP